MLKGRERDRIFRCELERSRLAGEQRDAIVVELAADAGGVERDEEGRFVRAERDPAILADLQANLGLGQLAAFVFGEEVRVGRAVEGELKEIFLSRKY